MAKEKEKREGKHSLWFEPEQMESLMKVEEDIHKMMRDFWRKPFDLTGAANLISRQLRTIPIDLSETDGELVARADLPGFSKDEIRLKVTENSLEISAEKKREIIKKDKNYFRQERAFGSMQRIMALPYSIRPDEAKARFDNGVLTVTMQKTEPKKKVREIRPE